jgi:hypothetical protein
MRDSDAHPSWDIEDFGPRTAEDRVDAALEVLVDVHPGAADPF